MHHNRADILAQRARAATRPPARGARTYIGSLLKYTILPMRGAVPFSSPAHIRVCIHHVRAGVCGCIGCNYEGANANRGTGEATIINRREGMTWQREREREKGADKSAGK